MTKPSAYDCELGLPNVRAIRDALHAGSLPTEELPEPRQAANVIDIREHRRQSLLAADAARVGSE